jgi:hypothetical protein
MRYIKLGHKEADGEQSEFCKTTAGLYASMVKKALGKTEVVGLIKEGRIHRSACNTAFPSAEHAFIIEAIGCSQPTGPTLLFLPRPVFVSSDGDT